MFCKKTEDEEFEEKCGHAHQFLTSVAVNLKGNSVSQSQEKPKTDEKKGGLKLKLNI